MSEIFIFKTAFTLLLLLLGVRVSSKEPPVANGPLQQYLIVPAGSQLNLTCPFRNVEFFKWSNVNSPIPLLSEAHTIAVMVSAASGDPGSGGSDGIANNPPAAPAPTAIATIAQTTVFQCEAVNGYGQTSAVFFVKIINQKSRQFQTDCKSQKNGPCFLVSAMRNYFEYEVQEGSQIGFDCRALMNSAVSPSLKHRGKDGIKYTWRQLSASEYYKSNQQYPPSGGGGTIKGPSSQMLESFRPLNRVEPTDRASIGVWGPIVRLNPVQTNMQGVYECVATPVGDQGNPMTRVFSLRVTGAPSRTIHGPAVWNVTVARGSKIKFPCRVSGSSMKPKWGKRLRPDEEPGIDEAVVSWENSKFRILQGTLDLEAASGSSKSLDSATGDYINELPLTNIKPEHAGTYICSVLRSDSVPEHKFVHLTVTDDGSGLDGSTSDKSTSMANRNFPIYIAVPTVVFVLCVASLIYCCVHRHRVRQKAAYKNRAAGCRAPLGCGGAAATATLSSGTNPSLATGSGPHHVPMMMAAQAGGNSSTSGNGSCGPRHPGTTTSGSGSYHQQQQQQQVPPQHYPPATLAPQPTPYDSDSTPSPPPPTSITGPPGDSLTYYHHHQQQQQQQQQPPQPHHLGANSLVSSSSSNPSNVHQQQQLSNPVYPSNLGIMFSA